MPRVVAILNPARSGARRAADLLHAACASRGWPPVQVLPTTEAEPGGTQAARALGGGADLVVAGGGDGTVREVAQVLAGSGVPLGVLPLGAGNLLARNLDLPRDLGEAVRVALDGTERLIDLGRVRYEQEGPGGAADSGEQVFLVVVGIGHDATTVAHTRPWLKRHLGALAYLLPGLRRLRAPLLPMRVRRDGGAVQEVRAWSLLLANCGSIPWGIQVVPGARLDDGVLDAALVAPRSLWGWVPIALQGVLHHRRPVSGIGFRPAHDIRVSLPAPTGVQVDGDAHPGVREVTAWVDTGALRVRVRGPAPRRQPSQA